MHGLLNHSNQMLEYLEGYYDLVADYMVEFIDSRFHYIVYEKSENQTYRHVLIFVLVFILLIHRSSVLSDIQIIVWLQWKHDFTWPKLQIWLVYIMWINKIISRASIFFQLSAVEKKVGFSVVMVHNFSVDLFLVCLLAVDP